MTTTGAASDDTIVKMTKSVFQWMFQKTTTNVRTITYHKLVQCRRETEGRSWLGLCISFATHSAQMADHTRLVEHTSHYGLMLT